MSTSTTVNIGIGTRTVQRSNFAATDNNFGHAAVLIGKVATTHASQLATAIHVSVYLATRHGHHGVACNESVILVGCTAFTTAKHATIPQFVGIYAKEGGIGVICLITDMSDGIADHAIIDVYISTTFHLRQLTAAIYIAFDRICVFSNWQRCPTRIMRLNCVVQRLDKRIFCGRGTHGYGIVADIDNGVGSSGS